MRASEGESAAGALERGENSRGGNGERRGPEKRKKIACIRRRELALLK